MISLIRRTGYERMPVHFSMTPDIAKRFNEYTEKVGYQVPSSPFAGIPGSKLLNPAEPGKLETVLFTGLSAGNRF